jgi:hypothetical protein
MINKLKQFEGVGNILFGSKRTHLREIVEGTYKVIKRGEYAESTSDYYEELGFFIEYTKNNICEAIEFTSSSSLIYEGQDLFLLKYLELRRVFDERSTNWTCYFY